jgi:hypothetical protein
VNVKPDVETMPYIRVSRETLEIVDALAKLVLELFERYEQGFEFMLVRDIPAELLKEFDEKIVKPFYPSGHSEAVQDLMRKTIREQQE